MAFLDDDTVADSDWLAQLMLGYQDSNVVGVGGLADPIWPSQQPGWFPEEFLWVLGCSHRLRQVISGGLGFRCVSSFRVSHRVSLSQGSYLHAVYLYHRFLLSYRDVQELLFERGIEVSHKTVRAWCVRFRPDLTEALRHRKLRRGRTWHLDEVLSFSAVSHTGSGAP